MTPLPCVGLLQGEGIALGHPQTVRLLSLFVLVVNVHVAKVHTDITYRHKPYNVALHTFSHTQGSESPFQLLKAV